MAKKTVSPVYAVAPTQERESRWQCAGCRAYLAFSLPIAVPAMAALLQIFGQAHVRCPFPAGFQPVPAAPPEPVAPAMSYDPDGPTAKALARREALLALPRKHTAAERAELGRLEKKLIMAGVLQPSTTF